MESWQTLDEIIAARTRIIASLSGWQHPAANGIGFVPLGEEPRAEHFPVVNTNDHVLPGAIASAVLGYRRGSCVLEVSRTALDLIIERLEPAEACTEVPHPNLWMWRDTFRTQLDAGAAGRIVAVFVASLDDPMAGPEDAAFRAAVGR
jgi:hypothetical protein